MSTMYRALASLALQIVARANKFSIPFPIGLPGVAGIVCADEDHGFRLSFRIKGEATVQIAHRSDILEYQARGVHVSSSIAARRTLGLEWIARPLPFDGGHVLRGV